MSNRRLRLFGGLWLENPSGEPDASPQRQPLLLLAYLALAGPGITTREALLRLFWADVGEERARMSRKTP